MKTVHVKIIGTVQGVFFRDFTRRKAEELCLVGWVKNMPDGSVESLISGNDEDINSMVAWFHSGSPQSSVIKVITEEVTTSPDSDRFVITY